MILRRNGDPVRSIRQAVDNSLMGRLLGLGDRGEMSSRDQIPAYDPNSSVYDRDPAGLPSTFDDIADFTALGDVKELINAVGAARDGRFVEASIAPLLMVLPQAVGNRLKATLNKVRLAKMVKNPVVREGQVVQAMGELNKIGDEVMNFRKTNPDLLDQAMRESVQTMNRQGSDMQILPIGAIDSEDLLVDALAARRQRDLGYTGIDPRMEQVIPTVTGERLGGPPITSVDPRGMQMVTGTPTDRAVQNALLHQHHGSANRTGLIGSDEMQRMAMDVPLHRTPVEGATYSVVRNGDKINIKARDIQEGDVITSLSQQATGGEMGADRLVSTSAGDIFENRSTFGNTVDNYSPAEKNFFNSKKFLDLPQDKQKKLALLNESILDPESATQFDDLAYSLGLGKESKEIIESVPSGPAAMGFEDMLGSGDLDNSMFDFSDPFEADESMFLKKGSIAEPNFDPSHPSFKIVHTKGMPVTRADTFRPGGRNSGTPYTAEDELGVAARQAFKVMKTGMEEQGVPFMLLRPDMRKQFKYSKGGKFKVIKR